MAMKIVAQTNIKVSDLVNGYLNDTATGAVEAYNGRLNVRPAYQREFVWDKGSTTGGKKQEAPTSIGRGSSHGRKCKRTIVLTVL